MKIERKRKRQEAADKKWFRENPMTPLTTAPYRHADSDHL